MDERQLHRLKPELETFLERFAPHFGHPAHAAHAGQFVQGLLRGGERRSAENIAEAVDGGVVRSLQKFLGQGRWSDAEILDELQRQVVAELGEPDAVLNVDETGFPKKGTKSVGVQRQYAGSLGQVGVFVNYSSAAGRTLIDRRLFVPRVWADDAARRREAGVPAAVVFRTKPALALEMVRRAVERNVPFRWVTGDSVYGGSPTFVRGLRQLGKVYVVDLAANAWGWANAPAVAPPGTRGRRGRASSKARVLDKPEPIAAIAARLPASAWRAVTVAPGSQGPRVFEYAELRVWISEDDQPAGPERLLVRRTLSQQPEIAYHRSNAPPEVSLEELARVRGTHWSVEQSFEAAKGECGLDEYETRGWVGWHHHTALSLLALWFLEQQRRRLGEKRAADDCARGARPAGAPPRRPPLGRRRGAALECVAS